MTLRLVARWGDACNLGSMDPDVIRHKLNVLQQHCDEVGRDMGEITRSHEVVVYLTQSDSPSEQEVQRALADQTPDFLERAIIGRPEQVVEGLRPLREAGIDYFVVYMPRIAYELEKLDQFVEEVLPHFE